MESGHSVVTGSVCSLAFVFVCLAAATAGGVGDSEPAARGAVPFALPAELSPAGARLLDAASEHAFDIVSKAFEQATPESARELIAALWRDWGDPAVNYDYQDIILGLIADLDVAGGADALRNVAFKRALREGLVEFYYSGGMNDPQISIAGQNLAEAFFQVSDPSDTEVATIIMNVGLSLAESRLESREDPDVLAAIAAQHGVSVEQLARLIEEQQEAFRKRLKAYMAGAGRVGAYETLEQAFGAHTDSVLRAARDAVAQLEWQEASPLIDESVAGTASQPASASTRGDRQRLRAWFEDLRRVTSDGGRTRADVLRVAQAVQQGFGNRELDEQALRALLIAYRRILESRSPRPTKEVVETIDADLVRIGRLELPDDKSRQLWARAAYALGQRASPALREVIDRCASQERDARIRAVLEAAQARIRRSRG